MSTIRIDSVLFYQLCAKDRTRSLSRNWKDIKPELQDGVYEVKEADGSLSYAFVSHGEATGFIQVEWMDEREYELHLYDAALTAAEDARLREIMSFEFDEDDV